MPPISYARHQFPPEVIRQAVWLYLRFTLSYRDVEDLLAERGLEVSYETVRRWVLKFGPAIARRLRQRRPKPSPRWHLDEMVILSVNSAARLPGLTMSRDDATSSGRRPHLEGPDRLPGRDAACKSRA